MGMQPHSAKQAGAPERTRQRLIYVTIGTGIGTGFIIDGHLYRGVDYSHPEIGHHLVDPPAQLASAAFADVGNLSLPVRP